MDEIKSYKNGEEWWVLVCSVVALLNLFSKSIFPRKIEYWKSILTWRVKCNPSTKVNRCSMSIQTFFTLEKKYCVRSTYWWKIKYFSLIWFKYSITYWYLTSFIDCICRWICTKNIFKNEKQSKKRLTYNYKIIKLSNLRYYVVTNTPTISHLGLKIHS